MQHSYVHLHLNSKKTFSCTLFLFSILFLLIFFNMGDTLFAQTSIIDQMLKTQSSLVSIKAENSSLYKSPKLKPFIDSKTGKMVVLRNLAKASYQRHGAGVIVHSTGIIVTNAHTIHKANRITIIFHNKKTITAHVVKVINNIDLAFLKVEVPFKLKSIPFADSDRIHLGEEIMTIGNSKLLKQTVSGGKIVGIGTSKGLKKTGKTRTDLIQTSIGLYEGDSGGPLFNNKGHLIGLMTAKETSGRFSSFAIPSNQIKKYLIEYLNHAPK